MALPRVAAGTEANWLRTSAWRTTFVAECVRSIVTARNCLVRLVSCSTKEKRKEGESGDFLGREGEESN